LTFVFFVESLSRDSVAFVREPALGLEPPLAHPVSFLRRHRPVPALNAFLAPAPSVPSFRPFSLPYDFFRHRFTCVESQSFPFPHRFSHFLFFHCVSHILQLLPSLIVCLRAGLISASPRLPCKQAALSRSEPSRESVFSPSLASGIDCLSLSRSENYSAYGPFFARDDGAARCGFADCFRRSCPLSARSLRLVRDARLFPMAHPFPF